MRKAKRKAPARKPRALKTTWVDAECWTDGDAGGGCATRAIDVTVHQRLNAYKAAKLSLWLYEAAAWKAEE